MKVSAVVVSHGHSAELARSLPAIRPQVDELLVIANLPGSADGVPADIKVLANTRPLSFAANVNKGTAATTGEYVLASNPDAVPEPGAIAELVAFADAHPRAGLVGPLVFWPDGRWQPTLRRFPTVLGTLWRRTPLRLVRQPDVHQTSHYGTRPDEPVQGDWLLGGACLLMRRTMLDELGGWDPRYRHYVEDIDVAYRAAKAGWERWLVPAAVVTHDYAAVIDKRFLSRHTLWHLRGMLRFVRKHRLSLPKRWRGKAPPPPAKGWTTAGTVKRWSDDDQYADVHAYFARRAELVVSVGPRLESGDTVLDVACADGRLAEFLEPYGIGYRGLDTVPAMVEQARAHGIEAEVGDLNDYVPPAPITATLCFRAIYYSRDRAAFFRHVAGYTTRKLVFDLNPRQYPLAAIREELRAAGFTRVDVRPLFAPQRVRLPRAAAMALRALECSGPLARLTLRYRFTYVVAASR